MNDVILKLTLSGTEPAAEILPAEVPIVADDDGIRPAGRPDECFYCHRRVGDVHRRTCVIVTPCAVDGGLALGTNLAFTETTLDASPASSSGGPIRLSTANLLVHTPTAEEDAETGRAILRQLKALAQTAGIDIAKELSR